MRKIAIRKLNRTLLKKEGTKQFYITGKNVLLPFFGYSDIEQLDSTQTSNNKKDFYLKKEYYRQKSPEKIETYITRANGEVRLTGESLGEIFLQNDIKEVDSMILECVQDKNENEIFLLEFIKKECRVLQKYDTKDDKSNYQSVQGGKFEYVKDSVNCYPDGYWLWDDSFSDDRWKNILSNYIEADYYNRGEIIHKTIRIKEIGTFFKYMKAVRAFQEKKIYSIEERNKDEWIIADFKGIGLLEVKDETNKLVFTNRNNGSWKYYEREDI